MMLQVSELREELVKRGLDNKGNKADLVARLEAAEAEAAPAEEPAAKPTPKKPTPKKGKAAAAEPEPEPAAEEEAVVEVAVEAEVEAKPANGKKTKGAGNKRKNPDEVVTEDAPPSECPKPLPGPFRLWSETSGGVAETTQRRQRGRHAVAALPCPAGDTVRGRGGRDLHFALPSREGVFWRGVSCPHAQPGYPTRGGATSCRRASSSSLKEGGREERGTRSEGTDGDPAGDASCRGGCRARACCPRQLQALRGGPAQTAQRDGGQRQDAVRYVGARTNNAADSVKSSA